MNVAVVKNNSNNIFAAFGDKITQYGNPPVVLRNKLYLSNLITKKNDGNVFITTYLSSEQKSCGSNVSPDIENILLYNLGEYRPINDLISMADKIIIQGIDNLKRIKPPRINWSEWHYYFYGTFGKNNYQDFLLYEWDYSKSPNFYLDIKDFNKLINSIDKNEDLRLILNRYHYIQNPVVPKNTKYVLRIECPLILYEAVKNLKNLIDTVIIFCNVRNIIEHPYRNQLVEIKNGEQYNPTDDFLYYCEIERENISCIKFYVVPILNDVISNCGRVREDKVNSFPGFRNEDEIKFCGEEEKITKKNNPNNFPGFKKEDEIIEEKGNHHRNNQTLGLTNDEKDQQNRNESPFIVNVDVPTKTVTIHKNTCPYRRRMGHIVHGNGRMIGFDNLDEAVKYVNNNYGNFNKRFCKACFPERR